MLIIVKKSSPTVYRSTGHTGRLICISITGILGCPRRATGVPLAKGSWCITEGTLRKPLEQAARGSQLPGQERRERLTLSRWDSQEGRGPSEVDGRYKACGKPQLECNAVEFYLAKQITSAQVWRTHWRKPWTQWRRRPPGASFSGWIFPGWPQSSSDLKSWATKDWVKSWQSTGWCWLQRRQESQKRECLWVAAEVGRMQGMSRNLETKLGDRAGQIHSDTQPPPLPRSPKPTTTTTLLSS